MKLDIRWPDGSRPPRPVVVLIRRKDKALGPAGSWLADALMRTGMSHGREARTRKKRKTA